MMKRIIALLLALILTVGLLPTVALAAEPTAPTDETPGEDAVSFTKDVVTKNGQDMIKIEAYVNGDVKTQVTTTPCDIVLVLDQSGSMADKIKAPGYNYTEESGNWSYSRVNSGTYYYHCSRCGDYHKVEAERDYSLGGPYYYLIYDCPRNWSYDRLYNGNDWWRWNANETIYTGTLYTRTETAGSDKTKVEALKEAANTFLQVVSESAVANKVNHRVSIVGFGSASDRHYTNTEVLSVSGTNSWYQDENNSWKQIGQEYSSNATNRYKDSLVAINSGTSINPMLTNAVKAVAANGATAVDLGLDMASKVFSNQSDATQKEYKEGTRARIVVVVTDGIPTHSSGLEKNVASTAINTAGNLEKKGAKVFAVGIALDTVNEKDGGAGATPTNAKNFISWVSSDYPDATSWNNHGAQITGAPKYGIEVSTADSLKSIFADIAKESTNVSASAKLTSTAIMSDTLSDYFNLPANADTSKSEVYTSAASYNNGTLTWGDETPYSATVTISTNKKTITVTGFDYSANCVAKKAKDAAGTDFGKKLVIYIPIEKDATKAQFGGYLPTNTDATLGDTNGNTGFTAQSAHKDCTVVAPKLAGKTITIKVGEKATTTELFKNITPDETEWPDGSNNAGVKLVYTIKDKQGNKIATATVPAGSSEVTWKFESGKADENLYNETGEFAFTLDCTVTCKNETAHEGSTANSTQATGIIKVEPTTATVTLTKEITGSLTDAEKQSVLTKLKVYAKLDENNKTELVKGSDGKYSATLQAGNYTIEETNYTVDGYTCTSKLNNSDTFMFTVVAGQNQTLTLTNTYEKTLYTVTYTDGVGNETIFADDVHNNVAYGSTIPGFTSGTPTREGYNFNSWKWYNSTDTAYESEITPAPTTMPAYNLVAVAQWIPATDTNYIVEHYLQNLTGDGYTKQETETKTGTTGATATATPKTYPGFTCDESVEGTIKSGTIAANGSLVLKLYYTRNSYTVKYQYTGTVPTGASTLPPEVTYKYGAEVTVAENATAPDHDFSGWGTTDASINNGKFVMPAKNVTITGSWTQATYDVNLSPYVKKTLEVDGTLPTGFSETFKVDVTVDGQRLQQKGTVTMTAAGTSNFNMPTVALTKGTHTIMVQEVVDDSTKNSNIAYDTNQKTFVLNIPTSGAAAPVQYGTTDAEGNFVEVKEPAFVTITNTYTEPKAPSVVSKKVVTTDVERSPSLNAAISEFQGVKTATVLYPTGNGTTSNTLEVNKGTSSVILLYAITVNKGTTSNEIRFTDNGATCIFAERATVDKDEATGEFVVTFNAGMSDAVIYVVMTHALDFTTSNSCDVSNGVAGYTATTTVTEKNPNKLTINFADFVKKELTATGSKTVDEATFIVDVAGSYDGEAIANALTPTEMQATTDEDVLNTTLTASIKNIVGGNVYEEPFTGSVTVSKPGHYTFTLTERKGTQSGVTYDEAHYQVFVNIMRVGDNLVIHDATTYLNNEQVELIKLENDVPVTAGYIVFKNTIDTGKDDYYPIIIPTIINKDTGMLNKTDHFAYVIGYPDGTVHPNGQITRAEVATIFFRLLRDEVRDGAFTTSNTYSDVAYGKWYNNPISTMSALGIITGYPDGTFKPNKPITRAEFAAIAARFDETQSGKSATFSDVIGHWAAKEIGIAYYNDWIKGYPDGTFKPDQNITRAEAMTLINRVLERKPESPADLLTNMNKWTDNMDTSKWYYLDVQEATNSHGYTRKTFNYELWRQMLPDPDWSRYER